MRSTLPYNELPAVSEGDGDLAVEPEALFGRSRLRSATCRESLLIRTRATALAQEPLPVDLQYGATGAAQCS